MFHYHNISSYYSMICKNSKLFESNLLHEQLRNYPGFPNILTPVSPLCCVYSQEGYHLSDCTNQNCIIFVAILNVYKNDCHILLNSTLRIFQVQPSYLIILLGRVFRSISNTNPKSTHLKIRERFHTYQKDFLKRRHHYKGI